MELNTMDNSPLTTSNERSEATNYDSKQFVVFRVANEEYGVDIKMITTIERIMGIARVPKTPAYIKGVINLRGEVIPVICLREKFDLPSVEYSEDTRIVIFKIEDSAVGIIVDSVAEVIQLTEDDIEKISSFTNSKISEHLMGVGKLENRIITLLNLEKIVLQ